MIAAGTQFARPVGTLPAWHRSSANLVVAILLLSWGVGGSLGLALGQDPVLVLGAMFLVLGAVTMAMVVARLGVVGVLCVSVAVTLIIPESTDFENLFRVSVGGVPVSLSDWVVLATVLGGIVFALRSRGVARPPAGTALLIGPFAFALLIALVRGVVKGNAFYYIANDLHVFAMYLAIPLLAGLLAKSSARASLYRALIIGAALNPLLTLAVLAGAPTLLSDGGVRLAVRNDVSLTFLIPLVIAGIFGSQRRRAVMLLGVLALVAVKLGVGLGRGNAVLVAAVLAGCLLAWLLQPGASGLTIGIAGTALRIVAMLAVVIVPLLTLIFTIDGFYEGAAGRFGDFFQNASDLEQIASYSVKLQDMRGTLDLIAEDPVFGQGLGLTFASNDPRALSVRGAYIDNWLYVLWAKMGLVGTATFAWLLILAATDVWTVARRRLTEADHVDRELAFGLCATFIPLVATAVLSAFLGYYKQVWWVVVYFAAIRAIRYGMVAESNPRDPPA